MWSDDQFEANLDALEGHSSSAAECVRTAEPDPLTSVVSAKSGLPVVGIAGQFLDSRRDPVAVAERLAGQVQSDSVVVVGFGGGFLVEALVRRGISVHAVVESSAVRLRAALGVRDLSATLKRVPVVMTETLRDPIALAGLRARAETVVSHGPSVVASPDLAALVAQWDSIRVAARVPRVLVVGPIYGGSLGIARSAARALGRLGVDARLFDASDYGPAHVAFERLALDPVTRRTFLGEFATLVGKSVVAVAREWRPDLVFALAQAPLDPSALQQLRALDIPTAFWFVENGRVLRYWRQMAPHYDRFYAIQPGRFLEQLADVGATGPSYLPVACDPESHRPVDLTEDECSHFGADVSFAGSAYLNRRRMFAKLTDCGLRLWGPDWTDAGFAGCVEGEPKRFSLDEMTRIFAATKINLNIHSANHVDGCDPDPDYVNPRTFELAASNAFQLVDEREPLSALFTSDEVVTFRTIEELRDLIAHYLADDGERRRVAGRARDRVLAEHTYADRLQRVLKEMIAPELIAATERPNASVESLASVLLRFERQGAPLEPDEALMRVAHGIERARAM